MSNVQRVATQAYHDGGATVPVVDSTNGYRVLGTQVVGAQGASVADLNLGSLTLLTDCITAIGTIQTTVNALLARQRAHGIIAP